MIASQISLLEINTEPFDRERIETISKRNTRIRKKNINLIFWNLIVHPLLHLIIIIYNLGFTSLNKTFISLNLYTLSNFKIISLIFYIISKNILSISK